MFAGWMPSLIGQPWNELDDARIWDDRKAGCALWVMAKRARRTEDEVQARLAVLDALQQATDLNAPGGAGRSPRHNHTRPAAIAAPAGLSRARSPKRKTPPAEAGGVKPT